MVWPFDEKRDQTHIEINRWSWRLKRTLSVFLCNIEKKKHALCVLVVMMTLG